MSLLAPAFLIGLLAVGLPLWLHRLSSENPNKQSFSSLMFLEPGEPRRVLARRLQYLLLLALRIALLVLLAVTFAGPLLERSFGSAGAGEEAALHLIVLDTSASMSADGRWESAQDVADELIAALGGGDRGQLLSAARRLDVITEATAERAQLRSALAGLSPGPFRLDYGQMMAALDGLMRGVESPIVLHLITDAQATSMPQRFAELAPKRPLTLQVHHVGSASPNWSVEGLAGSAQSGEIEASVRSFTDADGEKRLALELNGRRAAEMPVSIPANGAARVEFPPVDLASGSNRVRVVLEPSDGLAIDDQRFLVLKRPEPQLVLLISGDPRGRDSLFLASALETLQALALQVERVTPATVMERRLADYAFVVVTDAGVLAEAQAQALGDYVRDGGAAWLAFGQRSSGLTQVPLTQQRLQPFADAATGSSGYASAGTIDTGHPALGGAEALRAVKFFRYLPINAEPQDRVLIRLEDGTPLLIERSLGAGRVLLFASSLDRAWNDLPLQPVFVPFVAGVSRFLAGDAGFEHEASLGSTLALRLVGLSGGQIFDPRGRMALGLGGSNDEVMLDQIGFYEVVGAGRTELVAVNLDPRESDLTQVDSATLERWQALATPADPGTTAAAAGDAAPQGRTPLWPWLLVLLVVAAVMESLVGNWHLRVRRGVAT